MFSCASFGSARLLYVTDPKKDVAFDECSGPGKSPTFCLPPGFQAGMRKAKKKREKKEEK